MTSGIYTPADNDVTPSGHGPSAIGFADVVKVPSDLASGFASPEAIAARRTAEKKRMVDGIAEALKDADELARHEGPYTWGIAYHDHLFFQFFDRDGKPVLDNWLNDPEVAAWLLTRLNRPYLQREALAEAPSSAEGVDNKDRAP